MNFEIGNIYIYIFVYIYIITTLNEPKTLQFMKVSFMVFEVKYFRAKEMFGIVENEYFKGDEIDKFHAQKTDCIHFSV